jgi:hypothetical protein
MTKAPLSNLARHEPLYDVDPRTGAAIEVFFADDVLAKSFGTRPGWFWWSCRRGHMPDGLPSGPFATSYAAYRNVASRWMTGKFLPRAYPLLTQARSLCCEAAK